MIADALLDMIGKTASSHALPEWMVRSIVQAESGGNPWAIRFEPGFLDRYVPQKPKVYGSISLQTERIQLATSWGLMQIMGLTARERGYSGAFCSTLCDPAIGLEWGCRHLEWLRDRYWDGADWSPVVAAYNAGSPRRGADGDWINAGYVAKVMARTGEA